MVVLAARWAMAGPAESGAIAGERPDAEPPVSSASRQRRLANDAGDGERSAGGGSAPAWVFGEPIVAPEQLATWREDATLFDAAVLGHTIVAVGDHGAVVRSEDGGTSWTMAGGAPDATLRSLSFLTDRVGWVGGYRIRPQVRRAEGVVLHTRDGGRTWRRVNAHDLPGVLALRFFDERRGMLLAGAADGTPATVWSTEDGGRTWAPFVGGEGARWRAAAFTAPGLGVVAGRSGRIGVLAQVRVLPARSGLLSRQTVWAVDGGENESFWAAGDSGLIVQSVSGGVVWEEPPAGIPPYLRDLCDFRTVASRGRRVWVAGRPGSVVWHSPDGGRSWRPQFTGQPLPITCVRFSDDRYGIAVGAAGTVLRTVDGGRTWETVRGKGRRAAVLCVAPRSAALPWRLLARYSGEEGYRSSVLVIGRPAAVDDGAFDEPVLHDAVAAAGGAMGMLEARISIEQPDDRFDRAALEKAWLRQTDGRLPVWLVERVARAIRSWRPSIVVLPQASEDDAAGQILTEAIREAVVAAADAQRFPVQRKLGGLSPWRVARIVVQSPPGSGGAVTVSGSEPLAGCGCLVDDIVHDAAARICRRPEELAAPSSAFIAIDPNGDPRPLGGTPFAGLALVPGGAARRMVTPAEEAVVEKLRRQATRRAAVSVTLSQRMQAREPDVRFQGLVAELAGFTRELDRHAARNVWWELFESARRARRPQAAELAAWELLHRFPGSAEAEYAAEWLLAELTSGEREYQRLRRRGVRRQRGAGGAVVSTAATEPLDVLGREQRSRQVLELVELVAHAAPRVEKRPAWRYMLANYFRRRSQHATADRLLRALAAQSGSDRWKRAAAAELWLTQPFGAPPVPVAVCRRVAQRPRLDGLLADVVWEQARPLGLRSAGSQDEQDENATPHSFVMVGYDAEFLYLAASLRLYETQRPVEPQYAGRRHDDDLRGWDRISFVLDIDRDRSVSYVLTVDQRGRVAEALGSDPGWNPQLYVAVDGAAPDAWRVELAIPWEELVAERPAPGEIWALRAQRTVPHTDRMVWPPAEADRTVFGYLRFR
ncbi:MAG: hypothetical protein D6725_01705 [Planctomycetota bacterium]|nr:MAG: hypothetical protein D6725_01705 [Planctomycetota bacterium]